MLTVLPRLAAVLCHAGMGTVTEALAFGVPLVVAPIRHDQPAIAWQVLAAGAGRQVSFANASPAQLAEAVTAVLDQPGYRAAAERIAADFAAAGGAARAATELARPRRRRCLPIDRSAIGSVAIACGHDRSGPGRGSFVRRRLPLVPGLGASAAEAGERNEVVALVGDYLDEAGRARSVVSRIVAGLRAGEPADRAGRLGRRGRQVGGGARHRASRRTTAVRLQQLVTGEGIPPLRLSAPTLSRSAERAWLDAGLPGAGGAAGRRRPGPVRHAGDRAVRARAPASGRDRRPAGGRRRRRCTPSWTGCAAG